MDFNKLALLNIFLENAIFHIEEVCLLNHIKLFLHNSIKYKTIDMNEMDFFAKCLTDILNNCATYIFSHNINGIYLEMLSNTMEKFINFNKFQIIMGTMRRNYLQNGTLIDNMLKLLQKHFDIVQLFVKFLISINLDKIIIMERIQNNSLLEAQLATSVMDNLIDKYVSTYLYSFFFVLFKYFYLCIV